MPKPRMTKRLTLRMKHKVEKKVREHHRKQRREAKKKGLSKSKLKKDPGIPNLHPLKEELLRQYAARKERDEEEKKRLREERARKATERRERTLESLRGDAVSRERAYEQQEALRERVEFTRVDPYFATKDSSRRVYYREFRKLVEAADVVLEVLDARDPIGCRTPQIEAAIMAADSKKRIVLVLNKVDLVPKEVVQRWLVYLRAQLPTIAFKCSTQDQRRHLGRRAGDVMNASLQTAECVGADSLIQLLKNYARSQDMKKSITVGVIGYPNVGKSSLINSLKRSRAVGVGSTPGLTKVTQEIHLDRNIKLIDCPGIVFAEGENEANLVLRNCVKIEQVQDHLACVDAILDRCDKAHLMETYGLPEYNNVSEFLTLFAKRRGKIKQGGVPDFEQAARLLLQDWNNGKIGAYTEPPTAEQEGAIVTSTVVQAWGDDFKLSEVMSTEAQVLETLPQANVVVHGVVSSEGAMNADATMFTDNNDANHMDVEEEDDADVDIGMDTAEFFVEGNSTSTSRTVRSVPRGSAENEYNEQANRNLKKQLKVIAKMEKREQRKKLQQLEQGNFDDEEDEDVPYDFDLDYDRPNTTHNNDDDELADIDTQELVDMADEEQQEEERQSESESSDGEDEMVDIDDI